MSADKFPGNDPMSRMEVESCLRIATDKFDELGALFKALMDQAEEHSHTRNLARLGFDVAMDYGNQVGCWLEQVEKGGVKP